MVKLPPEMTQMSEPDYRRLMTLRIQWMIHTWMERSGEDQVQREDVSLCDLVQEGLASNAYDVGTLPSVADLTRVNEIYDTVFSAEFDRIFQDVLNEARR